MVIKARLSELNVKRRDEVFVHFKLPVYELKLSDQATVNF